MSCYIYYLNGGLVMKTITKSIVLTGVLGFFCSVSWGQTDICRTLKEDKEKKERALSSCRTENKTENAALSGKCDTEKEASEKAIEAYNSCEQKKAETQATCKAGEDTIAATIKDFDYPSMKKAVDCYSADTDEPADTTRVILMTMGGGAAGADDSANKCLSGGENKYSKQFEAMMKKIEQLEKDLNSVNEKLVTKAKEAQEKITRLSDERVELKEKFEKMQSDSEEQKDKALRSMQEGQMKLSESLRKANAELIDMRQKLVRTEREVERALFKDGLDSFASMKRQCVGQQEKYCKEAPNRCKKKTSKGLGQATARGSGKVDDLSGMFETCLQALEKQRNAVYQDNGDLKVQIENNIRDREVAIAEMNTQFKQQVDAFNKALEREAANLSKAQQSFYQKDQNIANQIAGLQQAAQQEQMNLTQQKNSILQQIMAAQTSRGTADKAEVKAAISGLNDYMAAIESFGPASSPKCPDQWRKYESKVKEFESHRTKIKEVEASQ